MILSLQFIQVCIRRRVVRVRGNNFDIASSIVTKTMFLFILVHEYSSLSSSQEHEGKNSDWYNYNVHMIIDYC